MHVFHGDDKWLFGDDNPKFLAGLAKRSLKNKRASEHENHTRPTLESCQYCHYGDRERCYSESIPVMGFGDKAGSAFSF